MRPSLLYNEKKSLFSVVFNLSVLMRAPWYILLRQEYFVPSSTRILQVHEYNTAYWCVL